MTQPSHPLDGCEGHELDGRRVYTRADLMAAHQLGLSTLESWYRERDVTGHPEAVGKIGRSLAWDAREWDAWNAERTDTTGLADLEHLAQLVQRSRATLAHLWEQRAGNGHPEPAKRIEGTRYWNQDTYLMWFRTVHLAAGNGTGDVDPRAGSGPGRQQAPGVDYSGNPQDLLTLAELGRVLGLGPTTVSGYAGRPPQGWPEPDEYQQHPDGRIYRRRYRRHRAWDYDQYRQQQLQGRPAAGRPAGSRNGARRYPYDGDPRMHIARQALAATASHDQPALATQLAREHGSAPGTWAAILTAARQHPTD